MGAYRNVALTELPLRGISINPATNGAATINVVPSDSGVLFVNKNATADCAYVLPALVDGKGKMFWFYNAQTTNNLTVTAPSANMFANDAQNTSVASYAVYGDVGMVVGDGSYYYWIEFGGTWTSI